MLNSSNDLSTWNLVGEDSSRYPYEGTRIILANGIYYLAAACDTDTVFYDLSMVYQGKQTVLAVSNDSAPHPMITPCGDYQYYITFDNTRFNGIAGVTGNLRIFRAWRYNIHP